MKSSENESSNVSSELSQEQLKEASPLHQVRALKAMDWQVNIHTMAELAWNKLDHSLDQAKEIAEEALRLSESYATGRAQALVSISVIFYESGVFDKTLEKAFEALNILQEKPSIWLARLYNLLANTYGALGERGHTLEMRFNYLEVAQSIDSDEEVGAAFHNLAIYHANGQNFERSFDYFEKAKAFTEAGSKNQAHLFLSLGNIYINNGRLAEGRKKINESLEISRKEGLKKTESGCLLILSRLVLQEKAFKEALSFASQSLEISKNANRNSLLSIKLIAEIYLAQNKLDEAQEFLLKIVDEPKYQKQKRDFIACHDLLHNVFVQKGEFEKALYHHKEMYKLDKKLFNSQSQIKSHALDIAYRINHIQRESEKLSEKNRELEHQYKELKALHVKVHELSVRDSLTGLYNRRYLFEHGDKLLQNNRPTRQPLSAAMLDIDHFKSINDTYGHKIGDDVLKELSVLLVDSMRGGDLVARYGGEEFAILMPGTKFSNAIIACERLRKNVENYDWSVIQPGLYITVSIGLSGDSTIDTCEELLSLADDQLYKSKNSGRNKVTFFG